MTRAKDISKIVTDADLSGTLDVTGAVTVGDITVNDTIRLDNEDTTISTGDVFGDIEFYDNDGGSASAGVTAKVEAKAVNTYGSSDLNFYTSNSSGGARTAQKVAMTIGGGNDISFYEDTGTTPKLFWDASAESLGIGTSSPTAPLTVNGINEGIRFTDNNQDVSNYYGDIWKDYNGNAPFVIESISNGGGGIIALNPNGGNVAINTTSPNTNYQTTIQSNSTKGALSIDGPATNGYWAAEWDMPSGSTYGILFKNGGSNVGNIRINAASTSYNTTSDHRLKENVTADWDATTRLKQLNPVRFNIIADADTTVDGFLAHEVQSVVPEAITGTHNEVDADGNPVYQGIDQSKLVPLLVKTIQELEARITALENGE